MVLSTNPRASYVLERFGIKYIEVSQWCVHNQLWDRYNEFTDKSFALTSALDDILFDLDQRYKDINLHIFDGLHYLLKICYDQVTYHVHLLNVIFSNHEIHEVVCADTGLIIFDEYGLFQTQISLFPEILALFQERFAFTLNKQTAKATTMARKGLFSFGQPLKTVGRSWAMKILNALRVRRSSLSLRSESERHLLSVGCKEVDALFQNQGVPGWKLSKYSYQINVAARERPWKHCDAFIARANKDPKVRSALVHDQTDFSAIILKVIRFHAGHLEELLRQLKTVTEDLRRLRPDCVIFQTMAPFYPPNILAKFWCDNNDVPYFCWMHGGYGAYWSLPGYDIVDWRLCSKHLVYGNVISDMIKDPRCVNNELGIKPPNIVESIGSPFFENTYASYVRPKNEKKKVMLAIGDKSAYNQFYFGYNRAETELSIWRQHYTILKELVPFQDKYEIILKDYPYSWDKELWRSALSDLGASKIQYICEESFFPQVMPTCDLHIYTWISTTFFQSLLTDADILVFDDGDLTDVSKTLLNSHIGLGTSLESFLPMLKEYLERGDFYIQNHDVLRSYFLDYENRLNRVSQLSAILNKV